MTDSVSKEVFCDAMSRVCAAVNVITTDGPCGRGGFTATAMCSVTDDPPSLLVCMRRCSAQSALFTGNGHFCVNVLSGEQTAFANTFANGKISMDDRYAGDSWHVLQTGSPALKGALVNLDCVVETIHETSTHNILIGRVVAVERQEGPAALTYFRRAYHHVDDAAPQMEKA